MLPLGSCLHAKRRSVALLLCWLLYMLKMRIALRGVSICMAVMSADVMGIAVQMFEPTHGLTRITKCVRANLSRK
jgi:hypothetical protein